MIYRYFMTAYGQEIEITKEQFIRAERAAGFYPKYNFGQDNCATGGFSNSSDVRYSVRRVKETV